MWSEPPSTRTCAHAEWGVWPCGDTKPSYRLWAQAARQLRLHRDLYSDLPEWIRRHRHGTVVLVRCGTRRWAYRKALSSPLFTQEREEPANLRHTYHSHEESLLPAQSFFTRTSTGRPVYEPSSDLSLLRKSSRDLENERIRSLVERQEHFTGIHDRFLTDPVSRESQLANGWTEQKCKEWDQIAEEDHTYKLTPEEKRRYKGHWCLTLNNTGTDLWRFDLITEPLYHESGEPSEKPIHPGQQRRIWRGQEISQKITCPALELINVQDGNIGLQLQVPRSGTNPNGVGSELTFFFARISLFLVTVGFVYSWWRSTVTDGECEQNTLTRHFSMHSARV